MLSFLSCRVVWRIFMPVVAFTHACRAMRAAVKCPTRALARALVAVREKGSRSGAQQRAGEERKQSLYVEL